MWVPPQDNFGGLSKFFYLSLCHDSLKNYFETNFALFKHHGMQISEIENLLPWEKEVYVLFLMQWIETEKVRIEQEIKARAKRG